MHATLWCDKTWCIYTALFPGVIFTSKVKAAGPSANLAITNMTAPCCSPADRLLNFKRCGNTNTEQQAWRLCETFNLLPVMLRLCLVHVSGNYTEHLPVHLCLCTWLTESFSRLHLVCRLRPKLSKIWIKRIRNRNKLCSKEVRITLLIAV